NPLTGPRGAAAGFGPQKCAGPESVTVLDTGLGHLAEVLAGSAAEAETFATTPGVGAAGGLPLTLSTLLRGVVRRGSSGATDADGGPGSTMVAAAVGPTAALP